MAKLKEIFANVGDYAKMITTLIGVLVIVVKALNEISGLLDGKKPESEPQVETK